MESGLYFEGRIRSSFSHKRAISLDVNMKCLKCFYFRFIRESMGLSKTRVARQFLKLPSFLMKV